MGEENEEIKKDRNEYFIKKIWRRMEIGCREEYEIRNDGKKILEGD